MNKTIIIAAVLALGAISAKAEQSPEATSRQIGTSLSQAQQIVLSWPDLLLEKHNLAEAVLKLKTDSDAAAAYWKSWCGEKPGCDTSK